MHLSSNVIFDLMSSKLFAKYLIFLVCALTAIALLVRGIGEVGKFTDFSMYTIIAFSAMSILTFYLGNKAARSSNKYIFNNLIIGNMILKMIVSVLVIFAYKSAYQIESRGFLIPFLIIYLCYTIFETYFLTKLAKG